MWLNLNKIEELGLFTEDLEQYQIIKDNFESLSTEDGQTAYELAKMCMIQSDRWNEIALNATKYGKEYSISKTDLYNWAYHRYRILMTMHEFCRVVYRQCSEDLRNGFRNEL